MIFNNNEQDFQGNTPNGFQFEGAFTFGSSDRQDWVKRDDKIANESTAYPCQRMERTMKKTETIMSAQQELQSKSNFARDERIKPIKSPNPPVGKYNIHKNVLLEEDYIKNISEKTKYEKKKKQFTIQTSLGKLLPNGEFDKHPTWVNAKEQQFREDPIGPGSYNPAIQGKTQGPISFGYKETTSWGKDGPSPDTYYNSETFSQFRTAASWKDTKLRKTGFGSAPKNVWPKSLDIGPGQYQPSDLEKGQQISFSKSERQYFKVANVPGPGSYAPKNVNVKKAFSIGHKYIPFKTSDFYVPGPGTYDQNLPSSVKNIKMLKDRRQDLVTRESLLKPGPGQYEIPPQEIARINEEAQFGQGVAERYDPNSEMRLAKFRVPSPGRYEATSTLGGPKFSMRLKNEKTTINSNPDPGKYEPDYENNWQVEWKAPYHYTVPQTATASLGKSNRSDPTLSKMKNIGPGSYSMSISQGGPRISMPKAARFPVREMEDVGPGSYKVGTTIGLIPKYHFEKQRDQLETSLTNFDKFHK